MAVPIRLNLKYLLALLLSPLFLNLQGQTLEPAEDITNKIFN